MTIENYNRITELREDGKTWKEVAELIEAKESYLTIKNRYNKAKKKKDTTNHTPIVKEEVQVIETKRPQEVMHHSPFSMDDLGILKNIIAEYKEKQLNQEDDHVEIHDWSLPAEYKKIKNTQVSIRLNKTLFDDLKKEVSKIDSDIKVAEIINKAMSDLLIKLK